MASYIQGVTDYIPQLQPFQPDYNFLGNVLQTRQSRYDTSHKQLNKLYGTLLYSPMLRDDNTKQRDQFFQTIDQDIKKMAGLDLSLQENSDSAQEVFKSMYDNKGILKDMVWTKEYQKQLDIAQNFKSCINPDDCGGAYWDGGVEELNYKADEFKKASAKDALTFNNVQFTPYIDVTGKAMKLAKDSGFETKFDQNAGGYIVTTTNGEKLLVPLLSYFSASLGKDPAVLAYYKSMAFIKRKNWVSSNGKNFTDENVATQAYMDQYIKSNTTKIKEEQADASSETEAIKARKKNYEDALNAKGVLKSDRNKIQIFKELSSASDVASANKDYYDNANNLNNNIIQNSKNTNLIANNFDELYGMELLKVDLRNAAITYAGGTMKMSKTADPFATQAQGHQNALESQMLKEGFMGPDGFVPGTDYYNKNEIEKAREKREQIKEQAKKDKLTGFNPSIASFNSSFTSGASDVYGKLSVEPAVTVSNTFWGGKDDNLGKKSNAEEINLKLQTTANTQGIAERQQIILDVMSKLDLVNKTKPGVAKSNLIEIFKARGYSTTEAETKTKLYLGDNAGKQQILKEITDDSVLNKQKLYNGVLKLIDPNTPEWKVTNNEWAPSIWDNTYNLRNTVTQSNQTIKEITKFNNDNKELLKTQVNASYRSVSNKVYTTTEKLSDIVFKNMSTGGFVDPSKKSAVIAQFVKENENKFSPVIQYISSYPGNNPSKFSPSTKQSNRIEISAKEQATAWATEHYDNVVTKIHDVYANGLGGNNGINAFDFDVRTGRTGTGRGGEAFTFRSDVADMEHNNTMLGYNLLNNLKRVKNDPGVIVQMANKANTKDEESSEDMIKLMSHIAQDFSKGENDKEDRMSGTFTYVGTNDDDKTFEFIYTPDESSIKGLRKGDENMIDGNIDFPTGSSIAVYIPKDKMSQEVKGYTDALNYSWQDRDINDAGLTITNPVSGVRTVLRDGNTGTYRITGIRNTWDIQSNTIVSEDFGTNSFPADLNGIDVEASLIAELSTEQRIIEYYENAYRNLMGTTVAEATTKK